MAVVVAVAAAAHHLDARLVVAGVVDVEPDLQPPVAPHDARCHHVRQVAVRREAHAHLVVVVVGRVPLADRLAVIHHRHHERLGRPVLRVFEGVEENAQAFIGVVVAVDRPRPPLLRRVPVERERITRGR